MALIAGLQSEYYCEQDVRHCHFGRNLTEEQFTASPLDLLLMLFTSLKAPCRNNSTMLENNTERGF